ncbi:uncharacterized protein SOCE26_091000 [Sorangium cellulosum]|uniref:Uncharacterized protein n=1 Tax=Sorangium cellulosum TaxID=56 RepID=A0A2L0F7L6_SORCE|nr:hypothetical protein [Sorangium cellulosum]AUX47578.1 uncharacterized protein SOCE26_091000 [Sorangium cellulosum]
MFDIEREFDAHELQQMRLILLIEDFEISSHFADDGQSLGGSQKRREEQDLFLKAFSMSTIRDKRVICVTDRSSGAFRSKESILNEALA